MLSLSALIATSAFMLLAYLLGSTMGAIWMAQYFGLPDPRSYGSGNPGATNMARGQHKLAAALTFLLDICKGYITVWLVLRCGFSQATAHLCGLCALLGHMFPLYHHFEGGKGAATYFGVMLALHSVCAAMCFSVWFTSLLLFRNSGFSAVLTACITPIFVYCIPSLSALLPQVLLANLLIIAKHYQNIERLLHTVHQSISATSHRS